LLGTAWRPLFLYSPADSWREVERRIVTWILTNDPAA
jgi:hypothetical protein